MGEDLQEGGCMYVCVCICVCVWCVCIYCCVACVSPAADRCSLRLAPTKYFYKPTDESSSSICAAIALKISRRCLSLTAEIDFMVYWNREKCKLEPCGRAMVSRRNWTFAKEGDAYEWSEPPSVDAGPSHSAFGMITPPL